MYSTTTAPGTAASCGTKNQPLMGSPPYPANVTSNTSACLIAVSTLVNRGSTGRALGVATFQTQYSQDTARIFAFTALSMVPALGFFVLAERRIVAGLTGSLKG